ncbi:hypothetical protein LCGC14_1757290 [marine sediment metagenome]|uniref:DksA C4-type domain-containing protein n=1 Tax=marine sediment metagenome TaxID=412755 RepID=A0A0F9H250_9ZZZZ
MTRQKKRFNSLKSPQLRKIRTNLRGLFRQDFEDHYNRLSDQMRSLSYDNTLCYEEKEKAIQKLDQESKTLKRAYHHSVLGCRVCGRRDLDLIFNPILNNWYCKGCYEFNQECLKDLYP